MYDFGDPEWVEWYVRQNHKNRKPCSCSMCGNPRRSVMDTSSRLTMAEKRADEAWKSEDT